MNKQRLYLLADVIEAQPPSDGARGFTMGKMLHNCGSPGCIAGWAWYVSGPSVSGRECSVMGVRTVAAKWLGLTVLQDLALFNPHNEHARWDAGYFGTAGVEITPTHAAAVLRHLARTGEVDWSVKETPLDDTESPYATVSVKEHTA